MYLRILPPDFNGIRHVFIQVCMSVNMLTLQHLNIGSSVFACSYILTISGSRLKVKVI